MTHNAEDIKEELINKQIEANKDLDIIKETLEHIEPLLEDIVDTITDYFQALEKERREKEEREKGGLTE